MVDTERHEGAYEKNEAERARYAREAKDLHEAQLSHERSSLSGLTVEEAREFHRYFSFSFLGFVGIAIVAHVLTYIAMPWGLHPLQ